MKKPGVDAVKLDEFIYLGCFESDHPKHDGGEEKSAGRMETGCYRVKEDGGIDKNTWGIEDILDKKDAEHEAARH